MMILLAILIAVVAVSMMMTVPVVSTRPLRATFDDPVFGSRPATRVATHRSETLPKRAERARPSLPIPASTMPRVPEGTGSHVVSPAVDAPRPAMPRDAGRINPNTWGRVRAEVGSLKTMRQLAWTS